MKFWTKKRAAALGLAALLTLSLAACGEKAPSLEEVEQAIEAGTLTVEDAQDKGWWTRRGWMAIGKRARYPPRIRLRPTGWESLLQRPCPVSPLLRRIWGMCSCLPL